MGVGSVDQRFLGYDPLNLSNDIIEVDDGDVAEYVGAQFFVSRTKRVEKTTAKLFRGERASSQGELIFQFEKRIAVGK